jgi:hypothetical protein
MSSGTSALGQVGAACFGIAIGYLTFRRLVRATEKAPIPDLAALVGPVGGAAVTGLFAPGTDLFAWYSIGLLGGMALLFAIFGRLNGLQQLATVVSVRTGSDSDRPGTTGPHAGEVS